jgi:hypothetical protein
LLCSHATPPLAAERCLAHHVTIKTYIYHTSTYIYIYKIQHFDTDMNTWGFYITKKIWSQGTISNNPNIVYLNIINNIEQINTVIYTNNGAFAS